MDVRDQYIRWLKANPKDGSFREAMERYLDIEPDPGSLVSTLTGLLELTADKPLRTEMLAQMALTEEILGQWEKAGGHYLQAAGEQEGENGYPYLLKAARLMMEQGLTGDALELTGRIVSGSKDIGLILESTLLKAKVLLLDDRAQEARDMLSPLIDQAKDSEIYPRILFQYTEALYAAGDEALAGTILAQLRSLSETNPDYAIASFLVSGRSNERIKIIQTPNTLKYLKNLSTKTRTGDPAAMAYVQVGSFSVLENAKVLLSALQAGKMDAGILEKVVKDKKYYKVVVKTTDNPDAINALISTLKTMGYEGILIKP
jgi:tetratricopeptide (TPR) repeat protein